jgi:hypothetical protein
MKTRMNPVERFAAVKKIIEGKTPTLEQWVATSKSLMDFPMPPSGKRLGDCTREDVALAASLHQQAAETQMLIVEQLEAELERRGR